MTRRELIKRSALFAALVETGFAHAFPADKKSFLKIGACDWSIGKSADVAALALADQIGLDGIQVNLGNVKNNLQVRNPEIQQVYLDTLKKYKVKIASLAIGELNQVPYKSDPQTIEWVSDSIDVAKAFNVKTVLLAFFVNNDLRNDDAGKKEVIKRLKDIAPKAEKAGVTLGIESYLTAEEHMDIIQQVGSSAIKVFYDFRNAVDAGNDVIKEIKWLGKDMICELHIKENGFLLGSGTLDWKKIFDTLMNMQYHGDGWMQIEWAMPKGADIIQSYQHNIRFIKDLI
ncbi:MAG: sugar phosphate isomerase/epimerase family protein [Saprospiraceae bacterium]